MINISKNFSNILLKLYMEYGVAIPYFELDKYIPDALNPHFEEYLKLRGDCYIEYDNNTLCCILHESLVDEITKEET